MAVRVHLVSARANQMLKITFQEKAAEQRWTLCGQLSGPWVAELRAVWERARGEARGRSCVVDLGEVGSIDEDGESLLRSMKADGARFVARGVAMRHILSHLRSAAKPPLRKSLKHLGCDSGRS
jgi:hypothetical protein